MGFNSELKWLTSLLIAVFFLEFFTALFGANVYKFTVCRSVHHHTIQINHHLYATISPVYYPDVYLQLNMFRASSHPSSGAQQLQ
jgi:hypothetical protein